METSDVGRMCQIEQMTATPKPSCLFCSIATGEASAHLVWQSPDTLGFLDIRPVFKGHVLVIPRAHIATLRELPTQLMIPLFGTAQRVAVALESAVGAQGTFVAMNNVVSQSVPHVHVHVVPRRRKDGLRGFFWPRTRYDDEAEAAATASRIAVALDSPRSGADADTLESGSCSSHHHL